MTDENQPQVDGAATGQAPSRTIALRKIYIKDMSFESPMAPQVFTETELQPNTNLNLRTTHRKLGDQPVYEMVLTLTLESKVGDDVIFLVELQQAGLFQIVGFNEAEIAQILATFCPTQLFPYAREAISSAVQRGGFPEFLLQPIDFDGLYARSQAEQAPPRAEAH